MMRAVLSRAGKMSSSMARRNRSWKTSPARMGRALGPRTMSPCSNRTAASSGAASYRTTIAPPGWASCSKAVSTAWSKMSTRSLRAMEHSPRFRSKISDRADASSAGAGRGNSYNGVRDGRAAPSSDGLSVYVLVSEGARRHTVVECCHDALANPKNLIWKKSALNPDFSFENRAFTPRNPLRLDFDWPDF